MDTLRELRIYVAKPDRLEELIERWENHYAEIFEDHMTVLGYYVSHPENKDMPTGVALLLEHADRADVDRTFAAAKATRAWRRRLDRPDRRSSRPGSGSSSTRLTSHRTIHLTNNC